MTILCWVSGAAQDARNRARKSEGPIAEPYIFVQVPGAPGGRALSFLIFMRD
jgi:hypothetical protein